MALKRAPAFRLIYLSARLSCISSLLAILFCSWKRRWEGKEDREEHVCLFAGHFDIIGIGIALAWGHLGNKGL